MAARFLVEAFVALPLTGKKVTAEEIAADPVCAGRLRQVLDALASSAREG